LFFYVDKIVEKRGDVSINGVADKADELRRFLRLHNFSMYLEAALVDVWKGVFESSLRTMSLDFLQMRGIDPVNVMDRPYAVLI